MKRGDKVKLITKRHGVGPNNPLSGTKFDCKGIITADYYDDIESDRSGATNSSLHFEVLWDNGIRNTYSSKDLESVFTKYKSIW